MMNAATAVIVLNWNGAADTLACLASLAKVRRPEFTVLVVDNGSDDASVQLVRRAFPSVDMLLMPGNAGYALGNNAGFARVAATGVERVVFLNNDTVVDPGFLEPLVAALDDASTGIAVPKICYMDDPCRIWYAGGKADLVTGRFSHVGIRRMEGPRFDIAGPTGYATGCCLAMRSRDFKIVGGFDERLGMYCEDVDLSLKIRALGMSVRYEPASKVWHRVSASSGGSFRFRKQVKKNVATLRLLFLHRAWSGMALFVVLWLPRMFAALPGLLAVRLKAKKR